MIKKIILPIFLFALTCSLTVCAFSRDTSSNAATASKETVTEMELTKDYESGNYFHTLTITDQDPITAEFDVELDGGEATFLVIEVTEDMEATAHYTYTTHEQDGAAWGYYLHGSEAKTSFDLRSGTENVYLKFWTDESVALKQGRNIFYISGNDTSCKMHFEISGLDHTKVSYVGMRIQEEALEMLESLEEVRPMKE